MTSEDIKSVLLRELRMLADGSGSCVTFLLVLDDLLAALIKVYVEEDELLQCGQLVEKSPLPQSLACHTLS